MKTGVMLSTLLLLVTATAWSEDQSTNADAVAVAAQTVLPCQDREEFRQFDFWLGVWDVYTADGTLAGRNHIEKVASGCAIVENWVGSSGVPGTSLNYVDVSSGKWVQVWSGGGGTQIEIRGGLGDEGMLLEGTINYVGNGKSAAFRGLWTPLPDGRVRQFFEQSEDGGKTWAPWFEGFYTRIEVRQNAGTL